MNFEFKIAFITCRLHTKHNIKNAAVVEFIIMVIIIDKVGVSNNSGLITDEEGKSKTGTLYQRIGNYAHRMDKSCFRLICPAPSGMMRLTHRGINIQVNTLEEALKSSKTSRLWFEHARVILR